MSGAAPDMVFVLPFPPCGIIWGGGMLPEADVMVVERPGGGAEPKILEKAASRWGWLLFDGGP